MFCPNCGTENENDAKICQSCGQELQTENQQQVYGNQQQAYNQLLKKSSVGERPAARGGTTRPDERPHHKLFFA